MKSRIFFLLLLLSGRASSHAQLNESDTMRFLLRAGVTGNYQQGNVNIFTLRTRVDFSFTPLNNFVFKSQNSSLYQEFSSKKADNDIFSRNYFYFKPYRRAYPFAIAYISSNYRRKVERRMFTGAGITYQLLNKEYHVLKVSGTAVYEANRFNGAVYNNAEYNGSRKINLWRGTLYIAGWNYLLNNHLRLYYDAYWQPALNNKKNYRSQFDLGADFPVWKGLNFSALYMFTRENVVISNIKQDDRILTLGVSYNLKVKYK